jgi:hypothetical protein
MSQRENAHALTLSKAEDNENEYIKEELERWDNITD